MGVEDKSVEELQARIRELEKRVVELYTLYNVSRNLSLTLQLDELFKKSMDLIAGSVRLERFFLVLADEEGPDLVVQAYHGLRTEDLAGARFKVGDGPVGIAVSEGRTIELEGGDVQDVSPFGRQSSEGHVLITPLKVQQGRFIGALVVHEPSGKGFDQDTRRLISEIGEQVANAVDKAKIYQRAKELSYKDELTGVYNRRYFFERLEVEVERARRYGRYMALLIMDVDHFKSFNDRFGHLAGDEALRRVASAMESSLRRHDVLARFGGEEFVLLLPETRGPAARAVAEKLRRAVEKTEVDIGGSTQSLTVTVGISVFPDDAPEALMLIGEADKALYQGKKDGRNRVVAASDLADDEEGEPLQ